MATTKSTDKLVNQRPPRPLTKQVAHLGNVSPCREWSNSIFKLNKINDKHSRYGESKAAHVLPEITLVICNSNSVL